MSVEFAFNAEQELLKKSAREFAETVVAPRVEQMETTGEVSWECIREMAKLGFMGVVMPREYGGSGLGHMARLLVISEVARVSAAVGMTLQICHLGIGPVVDFGSDDQKKKFLPPLARGERLATIALTEATGGSDPTGIQSTARLEGDDYVLNGRKVFITNSHVADVQVAVAKTGDGPRDFGAFILEKGMAGFRPGREEHKFGLLGCNTGEVILENCRVPKANMLGTATDGLRVAMKAISDIGRMGMAACGLGMLNACLEASVKFAKERQLRGRPIADFQAIQWKITDISADLRAAELLCYKAAWMLDQKQRADGDIALAKLVATEGSVRAAKLSVDIYGGYGCMKEYPVQRFYRDAQLLIPSAGTSEVMRMVVARQALA